MKTITRYALLAGGLCIACMVRLPSNADTTLPPPVAPVPIGSPAAGPEEANSPPAVSLAAGASTKDDLRSVLSGNAIPLTLHLHDMDASWREFEVGAVEQGLSSLGAYMSVLSGGQNLGGQYFTDGQTVNLSGMTYVVAYRLPAKQIDFSVILGQHADYTALPDVTTADSLVTLTLLNLGTIGAIDNIRPFDMAALINASNDIRSQLSSALGQRSDMDALTNLRELAAAVVQETQNHNGIIPAIQSPSSLKKAIFKDIRVDAEFLDPLTKRPFLSNRMIVGHHTTEYQDSSDIVMLYADAPGSDGLRAVAFLDGGARMVDHNEWNKLQASQHLP